MKALKKTTAITIHVDDQAASKLATDSKYHERLKHIDAKYHSVGEHIS
jgi:hypothetical protein